MLMLRISSIGNILASLLPLEDLGEGERLVRNTSTLVELAHELDPMETHRVQEDLEGVHHKEHSHHSKHVEEAQDEEIEGNYNFVVVDNIVAGLSEDDRDEHLTKLTVGKRKRPKTKI